MLWLTTLIILLCLLLLKRRRAERKSDNDLHRSRPENCDDPRGAVINQQSISVFLYCDGVLVKRHRIQVSHNLSGQRGSYKGQRQWQIRSTLFYLKKKKRWCAWLLGSSREYARTRIHEWESMNENPRKRTRDWWRSLTSWQEEVSKRKMLVPYTFQTRSRRYLWLGVVDYRYSTILTVWDRGGGELTVTTEFLRNTPIYRCETNCKK